MKNSATYEQPETQNVKSRLKEPTKVLQGNVEVSPQDKVEGTKDFNNAYDKLVKKFYQEEGANLLIPNDDMIVHEYNENFKAKVDVNER